MLRIVFSPIVRDQSGAVPGSSIARRRAPGRISAWRSCSTVIDSRSCRFSSSGIAQEASGSLVSVALAPGDGDHRPDSRRFEKRTQ